MEKIALEFADGFWYVSLAPNEQDEFEICGSSIEVVGNNMSTRNETLHELCKELGLITIEEHKRLNEELQQQIESLEEEQDNLGGGEL